MIHQVPRRPFGIRMTPAKPLKTSSIRVNPYTVIGQNMAPLIPMALTRRPTTAAMMKRETAQPQKDNPFQERPPKRLM